MITTGLCILGFSCLLLIAKMLVLERRITALEYYDNIEVRRLEELEKWQSHADGRSSHLTHENEWVPPIMKHRDIKS